MQVWLTKYCKKIAFEKNDTYCSREKNVFWHLKIISEKNNPMVAIATVTFLNESYH